VPWVLVRLRPVIVAFVMDTALAGELPLWRPNKLPTYPSVDVVSLMVTDERVRSEKDAPAETALKRPQPLAPTWAMVVHVMARLLIVFELPLTDPVNWVEPVPTIIGYTAVPEQSMSLFRM
jgi:hypothetical protein